MNTIKGMITRRTDAALNGLQTEFRTLCSRTDFENKLEVLKKLGRDPAETVSQSNCSACLTCVELNTSWEEIMATMKIW